MPPHKTYQPTCPHACCLNIMSVPHPLSVPQAHVTLYLHQNFADCVEAAEGKRQLGAAAAGALRQLVQLHGVGVGGPLLMSRVLNFPPA